MNTVALIGTLTDAPELGTNRAGVETCRMRIAVPRRNRAGRRQPGVVYVEVTTFGVEALDCAKRLKRGDRIGLAGRLERNEYRTPEGDWHADHAVLVEQLDLLGDHESD